VTYVSTSLTRRARFSYDDIGESGGKALLHATTHNSALVRVCLLTLTDTCACTQCDGTMQLHLGYNRDLPEPLRSQIMQKTGVQRWLRVTRARVH
jgi:hypothetical protein